MIEKSGRRPIASRRGCTKRQSACSLIVPMSRATRAKPSAGPVPPPAWIKPQLTRLIDEAPTGKGPHACAHRWRQDPIAHQNRPRLVASLPAYNRRSPFAAGEDPPISTVSYALSILTGSRRLAACRPRWTSVAPLTWCSSPSTSYFLDGEVTAQLPLIERKERLRSYLVAKFAGCVSRTTCWATALAFANMPASGA